jgi:hypothetical protein
VILTLVVSLGSPVLALGGVLLGLWLGQRRWKVEQIQKDRSTYDNNLRATYLELWDIVEDAHIKMRNSTVGLSAEEFGGHIADVNNFMIRKGLYIERKDRYLVLEYLFWTNEFLRRVVSSDEGRAYVAISLANDELPSMVEELELISQKADQLRSSLRTRIRLVIGAPSSNGWNPAERPSAQLISQMQELAASVQSGREARRQPILRPPDDSTPPEGHPWGDSDDWI